MKLQKIGQVSLLIAVIILLGACKKETSKSTGWEYNNPKNGGFEVRPYAEQETGPGLVFIEGGTFTMGVSQDDVMFDWNNQPRRVTIASFYMDETEVRNLDYLEYLYWLSRVYGTDYPGVYRKALPDTLVWREKLAYNEPLVEYYFRHPSYRNYPVVGVTWVQANDYCAWRTDRVNEQILIRKGIMAVDPSQKNENNFNTESYLAGQYEGLVDKPLMLMVMEKIIMKLLIFHGLLMMETSFM
jgi:sulfatase modifying factor 1